MEVKRNDAVLLLSTPIEDRLTALEARAADIAHWEGEDASSVRAIRVCVGEIREAMKVARERWCTTREAAGLSGWSEETLAKYARRKAEGESLPHAWRSIEARPGPLGGWMFRVSTVPQKPEARVA